MAQSFAQLAAIKLVEPPLEMPPFDLKQHWHRQYAKDGANAWLRAILAEMFGNSEQPETAVLRAGAAREPT